MAAPHRMNGHKSDKEWRNAIRTAVYELKVDASVEGKARKVKALRMLARSLVDKALDGDVTALKEIGDRLDGKPVQGVELGGSDGGPLQVESLNVMQIALRITHVLDMAARKAGDTAICSPEAPPLPADGAKPLPLLEDTREG